MVPQKIWMFVAFIFCSNAFSGGEGSGNTIFKKMSAQEAFISNLYDKVIERKNLPQSSNSYNPAYELCREAGYVRTAKPKSICTVWKVKSRSGLNDVKVFSSYWQAKEFAESDRGSGSPYCDKTEAVPTVYVTPEQLMKLEYKIDYYLKYKEKTAKNYVGSHRYTISPCAVLLFENEDVDWIVYGD